MTPSLPWADVPGLDNPFTEGIFPNIQCKPPVVQFEAVSSFPVEENDPFPTLVMDFPSLNCCYHQEVFLFPKGQIALSRKVSWEAPEQSSGEVFLHLQSLQFSSEGSFDVQFTRIKTLFHEFLGLSSLYYFMVWADKGARAGSDGFIL